MRPYLTLSILIPLIVQLLGCSTGPLLYISAYKGDARTVEQLINKGADVNEIVRGETALMKASYRGHTNIVKMLLDSGAKTDLTDRYDQTALMLASAKGHADVVKMLLDNGADVNAWDRDGGTALLYAKRGGHSYVVKLLKNAGGRE